MNPDNKEVMHPNKKAAVVHNYPKWVSTAKKITKDIKITKTPMYLYSANKKALDPLSMYEAISKTRFNLGLGLSSTSWN